MGQGGASKPLVVREYLRVSKDKDGKGASLDQQEAENHAAFAEHGWVVHSTPYRDPGRSASRYATREREQFTQLIADLENNAFDANVLAIWESSRGSRRVGEWSTLIDLCEDRGVKIFVTTHRRLYDPANPRDRRSLGEDAVDSEYESAKSSERIKRSVAAAANAGRVHGKNLYGYERHYEITAKGPVITEITPHPEQAPVVLEAARRVEAGESYYSIAKRFNELGIPPRRPPRTEHRESRGWDGAAIKAMLSTPAYAGLRTHNGEIVGPAVWPAIIEKPRWEALQALMHRSGRPKNPNTWTVRYLCTGIAFCGVCGAKLQVGKQNKGSLPQVPKPDTVTKKAYRAAVAERESVKQQRRRECSCSEPPNAEGVQGADRCAWHYRTYACTGHADPATGRRGFHVSIAVGHLDYLVSELIIARLERRDFLALVNARTDDTDTERRELLAQIERDERYLEDVKAQAAELRDLSIYLDQSARIQPQIDEARRKLERLAAVDPVVISLAREGAIRETWGRMPLVDRRRVIAALAAPQVMPSGRPGRRALDPSRVVPGWK